MERKTDSGAAGGFLDGLRGFFKGGDQDVSASAAPKFDSAHNDFNTALTSLQKKIAAQRLVLEGSDGAGSKAGAAWETDAKLKREQAKRELEVTKRALLHEIEAMHKRLNSGVDPSSLAELREFLLTTTEAFLKGGATDIEDRFRSSSFIAVCKRSGAIAWEKLNRCMKSVGETWPDQGHLLDSATDEERALDRERTITDIQDQFLSSSPKATGELVIGNVEGWSLSYPSPRSWLWRQVMLRSVGAGIQAELVRKVVDAVGTEGGSIRDEVSEMLERELVTLNDAIGKPGNSIEQMDLVMRETSDALEKIVVGKVLDRARPIFESAETDR